MDKLWKSKIRNGIQKTREKRKNQICKVYELKIDESSLNKKQAEILKMIFVEAKWLYNYWLSTEKIFDQDYKIKEVFVLDKNKNKIKKHLKFLSCSYRQQIIKQMKQAISTLSTKKKRGQKVGCLKFKSDFNCLDLTNHGPKKVGGRYQIVAKNKVKILGIKKSLIVNGLDQIPEDVEFANSKLIKKPSGYYLKVTTYSYPKIDQKGEIDNQEKKDIGIDFGIKNTITSSDGEIFNVSIEESERLKRLQRKLNRQQKGSNNRNKTKRMIKLEYEKMFNKKKDIANKIVYKLLTQYSRVFIQDDDFSNWHKEHGMSKKVQSGILGLVKRKLFEHKQVDKVDRFVPTTKMCYKCGQINNEIKLSDRTFICPNCHHEEDRDIKAAKTILMIGKINKTLIPTEHRKFNTPVKNSSLKSSMKQEDVKEVSH